MEEYVLHKTFKPVKIKLTEDDLELHREGWNKGDIIKGEREYINGIAQTAVWVGGKGSATNCVAYLCTNCELLK